MIFFGFLERDSFSQRISKIWRNKKYKRFNVILKLEFEVKNWYMDNQTEPLTTGVLLRWGQLSGGVPKIIFFLLPFFKTLKISLKFTFTPTLSYFAPSIFCSRYKIRSSRRNYRAKIFARARRLIVWGLG